MTVTNPNPQPESHPDLVRCDNCGRYGWHSTDRCPRLSVPSVTVDFPRQEGSDMTTTTTNRCPDVQMPAGIEKAGPWDIDGYRDLYGFDHTVTDHEVRVYSLGSQGIDGRISGLVVVADGEDRGSALNSDQARELAAALIQAAAEIDRLWTR